MRTKTLTMRMTELSRLVGHEVVAVEQTVGMLVAGELSLLVNDEARPQPVTAQDDTFPPVDDDSPAGEPEPVALACEAELKKLVGLVKGNGGYPDIQTAGAALVAHVRERYGKSPRELTVVDLEPVTAWASGLRPQAVPAPTPQPRPSAPPPPRPAPAPTPTPARPPAQAAGTREVPGFDPQRGRQSAPVAARLPSVSKAELPGRPSANAVPDPDAWINEQALSDDKAYADKVIAIATETGYIETAEDSPDGIKQATVAAIQALIEERRLHAALN